MPFVGQRTRHQDGRSLPGHTRTDSGWPAAETPGRREELAQVGRRKGEEELQTAGVSDYLYNQGFWRAGLHCGAELMRLWLQESEREMQAD